MDCKAEIVEKVYKCGVGYGVYIVPVISPYDDLIKTEPKCFNIALGIEIKIPVITHDFTNIVEHIIDVLGGFLQSSCVEKLSCFVDVGS